MELGSQFCSLSAWFKEFVRSGMDDMFGWKTERIKFGMNLPKFCK